MNPSKMFHNPYHFVPVQKGNRIGDRNREEWRKSPGHVSHSIYVDGTLSGRLVCRLETEDPLFIGSEKTRESTKETPGEVSNFELGDRPAIPATALRGLVSSIAEAASNSAMRVLDDRFYSFRKTMRDESLSAIGMVVQLGENYFILPLTLPTMERVDSRWCLPKSFKGKNSWFPNPALRVHFGGEDNVADSSLMPPSFDLCNPASTVYYGMQLPWQSAKPAPAWDKEGLLSVPGVAHARGAALIGQQAVLEYGDDLPKPWEDWMETKSGWVKGVVRVLGVWGGRQMPLSDPQNHRGKYHELFLPCAGVIESTFAGVKSRIPGQFKQALQRLRPIPADVVRVFQTTADERAEATKDDTAVAPYQPITTPRQAPKSLAPKNPHLFRLKSGDLVYFRPHPVRNEVAEISLSSIWRGCVNYTDEQNEQKAATTYVFLERGVEDPELVPLNPRRAQVTLAEQMFGFVEADPCNARGKRAIDALASRIRFTDARAEARPQNDYYLPKVTLKILDSPKPPCPTLYFRTRSGTQAPYIDKSQFSPATHVPQGRKFYLHRQQGHGAPAEPWRSRYSQPTTDHPSMRQHVRIRPIQPRRAFWFAVDFDNLTRDELGLLIYSLRPSQNFRHKLGMGKPIGLGKVRIDLQGLFQVDRRHRYGAEGLLSESRYAGKWLTPDVAPARPAIDTQLFRREATCACGNLDAGLVPSALRSALRANLVSNGGEARLKSLERIGETVPNLPVCYPIYGNQDPYSERDLYKWFSRHVRERKPQALPPLDECDGLPALSSIVVQA